MLLLLTAVGLYTYIFEQKDVYWPGFFSMMFFYALIFFAGSYWSKKKQKNNTEADVLLAGRNLPLWIAIFTMSATWIGGGYINGTAEATYSSGLLWVQAPWGYALSLIVGGLFFAKKMRRHQFKTMLDPLRQRFGPRTSALFFLPALCGELFWTGAILSALGSTFAVVLGMDFQSSIIISALIAIAYTAMGGLWAVAITDVIQMILLLIGLSICLPSVLEFVGGWDQAWMTYKTSFGNTASFIPSKEALGTYFWNWWDYALLLIFGGIPWQVYFQRVLSAKDENTARNLSFLAGIVCLIAAVPPVIIGIAGAVADWSAIGVEPQNSLEILPFVIQNMCTPLLATIALGAVAAAVMSSADSSILSAASMASWNVYKPLIQPDINQIQLGALIKKMIWIIGIAAMIIALKIESIYALWFLCSDFVYCLLFPALLCSMFDPKANKYGALFGFLIAFILRFGGGDSTLGIPVLIPYPVLDSSVEILNGERILVLFPFRTVAMLCNLSAIIIISRLTQQKSPANTLTIES